MCSKTLQRVGKILSARNGDSAADTQHVASELVNRFAFDSPGVSASTITTDMSILTAIGNDYDYEVLFYRQVQALGKPGDIFVDYSTPGKSPNFINVIEQARQIGMITISMTGNRKCPKIKLSDYLLQIPSRVTPKIQED